jgi:hypothetical protein
MKRKETYVTLTHNQVVPGSSPGGTTEKPLISTDIEGFVFYGKPNYFREPNTLTQLF